MSSGFIGSQPNNYRSTVNQRSAPSRPQSFRDSSDFTALQRNPPTRGDTDTLVDAGIFPVPRLSVVEWIRHVVQIDRKPEDVNTIGAFRGNYLNYRSKMTEGMVLVAGGDTSMLPLLYIAPTLILPLLAKPLRRSERRELYFLLWPVLELSPRERCFRGIVQLLWRARQGTDIQAKTTIGQHLQRTVSSETLQSAAQQLDSLLHTEDEDILETWPVDLEQSNFLKVVASVDLSRFIAVAKPAWSVPSENAVVGPTLEELGTIDAEPEEYVDTTFSDTPLRTQNQRNVRLLDDSEKHLLDQAGD